MAPSVHKSPKITTKASINKKVTEIALHIAIISPKKLFYSAKRLARGYRNKSAHLCIRWHQ